MAGRRDPQAIGGGNPPRAPRPPNNFAAVRLFGAMWVLVDHAIVLTGSSEHMPRVFGTGTLGIVVFFSIGGYLVAGAWMSQPRFGHYLLNRSVRIFPALAFIVLVTMFVVGPIVSNLGSIEYFSHPRTWEYLQNLALRPRFSLPGAFEENPYPYSVNGSLWTLLPTFLAYLVIPLLLLRGFAWRVIALSAFMAISVALAVSLPLLDEPVVVYGSLIASDARMWVYFAVGALLRVLLRREHLRADVAMVVLIVQLLIVHFEPSVGQYSLWVVAPYVLVSFGLRSTPFIRRADRFGDLSYGIFLAAFPIQQILVAPSGWFHGSTDLLLNTLTVTVLAALVAFVCTRYVEQPVVRLRKRFDVGTRDSQSIVPQGSPAAIPAVGDRS